MCSKHCFWCINSLVGTFSWYIAQSFAYLSHHFFVKEATSGCPGTVDSSTDPACFLRPHPWPPAELLPGNEGSSRLPWSIPPEPWTCWLRCHGKNYGSTKRQWWGASGPTESAEGSFDVLRTPPWWRRWRTEMPQQWTWGWEPAWPAQSKYCSWRRRW